MAVEDAWINSRTREPTKRYGRGLRYRVRWYEHGEQRAKSFRTKGEAERHWFRVNTEPAPERASPEVLVEDLAARWVSTKAGMRPKTQEAARTASKHVVAQFGLEAAKAVRTSDVRVWVGGMGGSASLRRQALLALSAMMQMAVDDGTVPSNPCAGVKAPKAVRRDPVFLTGSELVHLAKCADEWEPLVLLLGTTGLRVGEVANLTVGDFDAKRRRLRVRTSKTHQARDVPVAPSVASLVAAQCEGKARGDWLFTNTQGGKLNTRTWGRYAFARAAVKAGRPGMVPHELRHAAASLAIASGADAKVVQRMLGHASGALTLDTYSHLWDQGLDDVSARLDDLIGYTSGTHQPEHAA